MTDFTIKQGSTWQRVLRWESPTLKYIPITAIAQSAPVRITAPAHGVPDGWRIAVQSVKGMKQINALNSPPKEKDYHIATVVDPNTLEINKLNAIDFSAYLSGGVVVYGLPIDLTGSTARMQVKAKPTDTVSLFELTTENGGIVIDVAAKTITLRLTDEQTAALTFKTAVFSLEVITSGGDVTEITSGTITLDKEITR